jgi:photosystem II stability/assembly factor-like uncharacterized protein
MRKLAVIVVGVVVGVSGAQAGVISPQSGWYAGNPILGPSALRDVACAGSTCYAAGDAGTLLKSTDGGTSWSGVVTGVQQDLRFVRLIGGKADSFVIGGGCVLRRSDDGGKTFTRLPFTGRDVGCSPHVSAVAFPSDSLGYLALGDGNFLSTADGGRTYSRRTAVPGGLVNDLRCSTETTCFAVTAGGTIQRTTDGGVSWVQVLTPGPTLRSIAVASPNVMYAAGDALVLEKSTDGGATWSSKPVTGVPGGDFAAVRCAGTETCLFATRFGDKLVRTADGGDTFTAIVSANDPVFALDFASATRAVAVGGTGSAETSDDAGVNWTAVGSRIDGPFHVLRAASAAVAYAGGENGVLARTDNGGQSWANISPPTTANILDIAAPSAGTVLVLADDGSLQRSDNGGASYRILDTGMDRVPRALVALDSQTLLLIGPTGIRRSSNGGDRFELVPGRLARRANVSHGGHVGGLVFAYGPHTVLDSADGGTTWRKLKIPARRTIADVSFGSSRFAILLDTRRHLWRTANAGASWQEVNSTGVWPVQGIELSDAKNGFAIAGTNLLRTTDGGTTWHPQHLIGGGIVEVQASGGTAYALVGGSILYATTTGGDVGASQKVFLAAKPTRLKKAGVVTVSGRLTPADGGEDVIVFSSTGGARVAHATVASNGRFTTHWKVSRTTVFVAQIYGDADHAGAGTAPLTVKVSR